MTNIIKKIKQIQKEEKRILKKVLDIFFLKEFDKKDKQLLEKIITSFFDINKRFESIKIKQLTPKKEEQINNTLNKYYDSIKKLGIKVNSL
tara:strand:- start:463 stop:735 length:273 start_codon:yes stop_codon:yes gene_type:complete